MDVLWAELNKKMMHPVMAQCALLAKPRPSHLLTLPAILFRLSGCGRALGRAQQTDDGPWHGTAHSPHATLLFTLPCHTFSGRTDVDVPWAELNRKMMDPVMAQRNVHEQQMVVLSRELHNSLMGPGMGLQGGGGGGGGGGFGSAGITSRAGAGGVGAGLGGLAGAAGGGGSYVNGSNGGGGGSMSVEDMIVDLSPYMNTSTFLVR